MARIEEHEKHFSRVHVEESKIRDYLLNEQHRGGKAKAEFFGQMGFSADAPEQLSAILSGHCTTAELKEKVPTDWGEKYIFVCKIQTPNRKRVCIVSVWHKDQGTKTLRLITAYPEK